MFKVGGKCICLGENGKWRDEDGNPPPFGGPSYREILIIDNISKDGSLIFYKYDQKMGFDSEYFRPLDESFADEVLERVKEEINKEELVLI